MELLHGVGLTIVVAHGPEKPEVTSQGVALSNPVDVTVVGELLVKDKLVGENPD